MRFNTDRPSENVEDRRGGGFGGGGGFGFPGRGGGFRVPIGRGGGGMSFSTIILLIIAYFALKFIFGIDLLEMLNGNQGMNTSPFPQGQSDSEYPGAPRTSQQADVTGDAGKQFVNNVLRSTERVWTDEFRKIGKQYQAPKLVLFNGFVQSACGMAQSAMGPFYCPRDAKVYIDLSFYQDMKDKIGAPGDFAQAYVIAHEVGHHLQNLLGLADQVEARRMQSSKTEANALSVRMELQADCYAGAWANHAVASNYITLDAGDVEEGLNAAAAIGDDRLQRRSQGYVVPESFTHGSSAQRLNWFKRGMDTGDLNSCDTFGTAQL